MRKLEQNIKNLSAIVLLGSYLFLITANVFHFHRLDLGDHYSIVSNQNLHKNNNLNFFNCPVQLVINLLNNSVIASSPSSSDNLNKYKVLEFSFTIQKIQKEILFHSAFRAPPLFS